LVEVGQSVQATSFAYSNENFVGEISAIGSRIEAASRTFQLQASIDNSEDRLRPGMSFAVSMQFGGNEFPSVDPLAVQWDSEGSYVWRVSDGTANRLPIRIVERNVDSILVDGALADGNEVIIEGQLGLTDGAEVRAVNASFTSTDNQLERVESPETNSDSAIDQIDVEETES
jgi:RND family efflux transporter MFP subunit